MCLSPTDYSAMSLLVMKPCDSSTDEVSIQIINFHFQWNSCRGLLGSAEGLIYIGIHLIITKLNILR